MKHVARIFSLIIAVICALAVVCYIFKPFASISLGFTIPASKMQEMLGDSLGDDVEIDFEKDIGNTEVSLQIVIPSTLLLKSWKEKDTKYIREDLVAENVDKILTTLKPKIDLLAEKAVKSVAKSTLKSQLKEQMSSTLVGEDKENINKFMEDANINDEYLSEKVDEVFGLFKEGNKVEDVAETIVESVNEMIGKLKEADSARFASMPELDDVAKAELTTNLSSTLKELGIADEEGNLSDIGDATSTLLATLLKQLDNKDETDSQGANNVTLIGEEEQAADQKADELYQLLYDKINGYITDDIVDIIAKVLKVVAIVIAVEIFFWGFQIVKIIFKLFAKVPAIRVWCPIWFGWLPELLLGYIPALLLLLISKGVLNNIPMLSEYLSIFDSFGGINAISLKIVTSAHIPSILALVLFVISIPNSIIRKKIKESL